MRMETQVIKKKRHIRQGSKCQTLDCHSDLHARLSSQKLKLPSLPGIKQKTLATCVKQAMPTIFYNRPINRSNRTCPLSASTSEVDSLPLSHFHFIWSLTFANNQLDAKFFFMYIYFYSVHAFGSHVPIIRRINCINAVSGICQSVYMTIWCAG
jgi:hypothetical protein